MSVLSPTFDINTIMARLDRSSPEALLRSVVSELAGVASHCSRLAARLAALEAAQGLSDRLLSGGHAMVRQDLPAAFFISASHALSGEDGFHPLEFDETGVPYRWSGPASHFSLTCFINRAAGGTFVLRFRRLYVPGPHDGILCLIDGTETECEIVSEASEYEIQGTLPPRDDAGATVLTFICPAVASPAVTEGADDQRPLGLAFRWLRVQAIQPTLDSDRAARESLTSTPDPRAAPVDSSGPRRVGAGAIGSPTGAAELASVGRSPRANAARGRGAQA